MRDVRKVLALLLAVSGLVACAAPGQTRNADAVLIAKQGSFFVGGRDVTSEHLSLLPSVPSVGTITVDQIYVHYQVPARETGKPLVLIHGCCLTGKTWEETPDGRMGWDELFVRRGHPVYVVDQASRGRSAADPSGIVRAKSGAGLDDLPQIFDIGRETAWVIFRFGPKYPEPFPGMMFPLDAKTQFWSQMVPDWANALSTPNPTVPALARLAERLGSAVLIGHSQSGSYPFQVAAINPRGIAGIVAIEPFNCPKSSEVLPLTGIPVLVLWGDNISGSQWAPRQKACAEFVNAINVAGGKAEMVSLNDVGFPGASHMLMQDRHSVAIGSWLSDWIERKVGR